MSKSSHLRVWAPLAESLDAAFGSERRPMDRVEGGWWVSREPVASGTDYAFSVNRGNPMPDPRSPWQPHGIHGPSRTVDHSAFQWTDHKWQAPPLASAIIYELHTGTFTPSGTFEAMIEKLDHLIHLGVTHIELMPVNEFSGDWGWGYDGVDLYAPHHCYGTPDSLKTLVNECHNRGLAVLLDVVYNHFGPTGNYLNQYGPYMSDLHHTPWGAAVNLDGPHSHEVRRFICDNALMWMADYHFDGLRLDAVHALIDTSARHILEQLASETEELQRAAGRHLALVAESDLNDPRIVRPRELGGYGIDAQWSDDFHHALHALLADERAGYYADFGGFRPLAKAFENVFVYDGCFSVHRNRLHGRPVTDLVPGRFIVFAQNHDQIGNRAAGERTSHLMSADRAKIAAALTLISPYVPMIFQGEEWAASTPFQYFTNHHEAWLADAVSEGRKSEFEAFGWRPEEVPDPQAPETLERSKLAWDELNHPCHAGILDWHRSLISLRRRILGLTGSTRPRAAYDENARWMRIDLGPVSLCFSLADAPVNIDAGKDAAVLLAQSNPAVRYENGTVTLPPESVAILGPA